MNPLGNEFLSSCIYVNVHNICIYICLIYIWGGLALGPYGEPPSPRGGSPPHLFILAAFLPTKRSEGVPGVTGSNKQVQTQQSKASDAVNLWRYWCFRCPWGSLGVLRASLARPRGVPKGPRGSQGRAQGIPGIPGGSEDVPGIPRILSIKVIP